MRRSRAILVVLGLLPIVLAMPFFTWLERAFLFHPGAAPTDERVASRIPGLERWWLETDQGPVEAWFVPGHGVSAEHPGPALIYAHGNAEVIDWLPEHLAPYREMGISLLLPEYRGYGRSAGAPSERAIRADFIAFHDRLRERPEVDRTRIVLHGTSLGGGVVAQLAHARPPAALVLQSTFTSVADLAWEGFRVPRFLIADPFNSIAALRDMRSPTLILHGRNDTLIPFAHGEALARAIPGSRLISCNSGHNDLPSPELDYWGELRRFLRGAGIVRP